MWGRTRLVRLQEKCAENMARELWWLQQECVKETGRRFEQAWLTQLTAQLGPLGSLWAEGLTFHCDLGKKYWVGL